MKYINEKVGKYLLNWETPEEGSRLLLPKTSRSEVLQKINSGNLPHQKDKGQGRRRHYLLPDPYLWKYLVLAQEEF